ncbi:MAG: hypothetical protein WAO61_09520 [Solirubrobacterales bacterium]
MSRFLVLYTAPTDMVQQAMSMPSEEREATMAEWMKWAGTCGDRLVEMGSPLGNGASLTASGSSDASSDVSGYSILEADSRDAAIELLDGHPHLKMPGLCSIEVFEAFSPSGK